MAVRCVAGVASQLINSSTNISIPVQLPQTLAVALGNAFSVSVWINANWGTSAAARGRKSFVGIYGPSAVTPGLDAVYYNNSTFTAPVALERVDANINFYSASGPPPNTSLNAVSSIVWTGYWIPPTTASYYFQTNADDGMKVTVNGVVVLNTTQYGDGNTSTTTIPTTAGVPLPIKVEYYNTGGPGKAQLLSAPNTGVLGTAGTFVIIPASQFQTSPNPQYATTGLQIGTVNGQGDIAVWTYSGQVMATTANDFAGVSNNNWVNITYTWDGQNHLLYQNGTLISQSTTTQIPGSLTTIIVNGYYHAAVTPGSYIANIDATTATQSSLSLPAGIYDFSVIGTAQGGQYNGWTYTMGGTLYREAFSVVIGGTAYSIDRYNGGTYFNNYASTAIGLADAANGPYAIYAGTTDGTILNIVQTVEFTLATAQSIQFQVPDNLFSDNSGGVSLLISKSNGALDQTDNHYVDTYLLYNRVLSQSEVVMISQSTGNRHGIFNGLIAAHTFNELSDGTNVAEVKDLTGGGASLLMTGSGTPPKYTYSAVPDVHTRPPVLT